MRRTFAAPLVVVTAACNGGTVHNNPPPPPSWKLVVAAGKCTTTAYRRSDAPADYACPAGLADGEYIIQTTGEKCVAEPAAEQEGGRPVTEVACPR
jgi:hypothetical protein